MELHKPVTIAIFLILIIVLFFLFVIPKYQEYRELAQTIFQKQAQYSGESIYYARITNILTELQNRAQTLDKINSALPKATAVGPLVDFIQTMGAANGVTITSAVFSQSLPSAVLDPLASAAANQIKDVAFTVNATGSYQGLKQFMIALDNSARLFEVNTVSFSTAEKPQQYSLKLEVTTHSY